MAADERRRGTNHPALKRTNPNREKRVFLVGSNLLLACNAQQHSETLTRGLKYFRASKARVKPLDIRAIITIPNSLSTSQQVKSFAPLTTKKIFWLLPERSHLMLFYVYDVTLHGSLHDYFQERCTWHWIRVSKTNVKTRTEGVGRVGQIYVDINEYMKTGPSEAMWQHGHEADWFFEIY